MNTILEHIQLWTTAQTPKTSGRGNRADNQQLLGIQKLRELILELAVRGKLVPQDSNDEPASVLLKKIEDEKKQLIKEEKIKKQEDLPEVGEDEKPFDLPKEWKWVRLGNVGYTQTGGTPSKNNKSLFGNDIPFIKPGDIYPNYVDYCNEGLSLKGVESLGRSADVGSILMVCIGTIGKCNLINRRCAFNQQINSISPYFNGSNYLLLALRTKYFQDIAWKKSSSTTIAILNKGKWENISVPLPPLAEQHRIVAKVDELMALCDQLEQQQTENNQLHQTLVDTLLTNLTQAGSPAEQEEAWQRISAHFDTLFTTEYSINQLKQTILQLAVMGKLVPQSPADEPASELLKKIAKEKARLVKEGKIKKQAPLPEITEDEKPFELPEGWEWVKCQDICYKITDGEHATPNRSETGHYLLSARNVTNEGILLDDVDFVPDDEFERIRKRCDPNIGDILISCSGSVGRVALVDKDDSYSMVRSAAMIRPDSSLLVKEYLALLLRSPYLQAQIITRSKQSAQANLFLGAIANLVFVIPPLAEQHRIVSKVDELFALCDALKERLTQAQTTQNLLAESVVSHALATKPAGKVVYATHEEMNLAAEPE